MMLAQRRQGKMATEPLSKHKKGFPYPYPAGAERRFAEVTSIRYVFWLRKRYMCVKCVSSL